MRGNPETMRNMGSHTLAVAGVLVAAVLASCLIVPAVGQLATWETTWLAVVIFCVPIGVVLAASGYRHYGWARSVAVAVIVAVIAGVISWVVSVFAVASALSGSATSLVLTIALYAIPGVSVLILGLLALKVVPGRPATDRQFEHTGGG
jgi:Kef-type K+ transport system membrane component KefB